MKHVDTIPEMIKNGIRRVVGALGEKRILLRLSIVLSSYWVIYFPITTQYYGQPQ